VKIEVRRCRPLKGEIRLPPDRTQAFHVAVLALLAPGRTLLRGWQSTPEWEHVRKWLSAIGVVAATDAEGLVVGPPPDLRERSEFVMDPFLPPRFSAGFFCLVAGFSRADRNVSVVCPPQAAQLLAPWRESLREAGWVSSHVEGDEGHSFVFRGRTPPLRELVCRTRRARLSWTLAALACGDGLEFQEPTTAADPLEDSLPLFGLELESPRVEVSADEEELQRRMQRIKGAARKLQPRRVPSIQSLPPADARLRGDLDLAGWCAVTSCLRRGTDALLQDVVLPASRSGLFTCLRRMGADIEIVRRGETKGVAVGDIRLGHGRMGGRRFDAQEVSGLHGFAALLSVAAVAAEAETVLAGLGDLRTDRDDQLSVVADGLRSFGVAVGLFPDGLVLRGEDQPGASFVDARGFPEAALAFHALGSSCAGKTEISGAGHLPVAWPHLSRVLVGEDA